MKLHWVLCLVSAGALVTACGDSDSADGTGGGGGSGGDTGTGTGTSTGTGTGTGTSTGTGTGTGTNTGTACYDEGTALAAPGLSSQEYLDHCTPVQVQAFYDACYDEMTGSEAACTAFNDDVANAECLDCVFPIDSVNGNSDDGTPPLLSSMMFTYLNSFACESLAQGLPQCGPPTSQLVFCVQTACEACEADADVDACYETAQGMGGICADIVVPEECDPVLGVEMLDPMCTGGQDGFEGGFNNVINYMCGAPPV